MIKHAASLAKELIPPGVEEGVLRWRLMMAGTMVAIAATLGLHVAWACGLVPGIDGFALAADVEQAQTQIEQKLSRLETSQNTLLRIALAQEICRIYRLRNESSGQLQRQLQSSLFEKQDEYSAIAGERYPVAECAPAVN